MNDISIVHGALVRSATFLALLALPVLAAPVAGQDPVRVEEDAACEWNGGDRDRYCETREYALSPHDRIEVDAGQNGGLAVTGWDRDEVRLIARIQASSRDDDPRALAREIRIRTGERIAAEGPRSWGRGSGWSVSFDLMVPRRTDLRLAASNGGIRLAELSGVVEARTTNGGIHLLGGAGDVRGETTNGGLHVELLGDRWDGAGLDLQTTNGGVEIVVPRGYSAELETGTVNGGMRLDLPVTVQGRIDRRIRTTLGDGGPLIRALTTNGGVVLRH
ncbi:MAG: hypothetical protein P8177_00970 [Gemmatimonadota bacterium]